jgi:transposase
MMRTSRRCSELANAQRITLDKEPDRSARTPAAISAQFCPTMPIECAAANVEPGQAWDRTRMNSSAGWMPSRPAPARRRRPLRHRLQGLADVAARGVRRRHRTSAYFDTSGLSNGGTEAINMIIEKIRRLAHGFKDFEQYRLRIMLGADGQLPYRRRPEPRLSLRTQGKAPDWERMRTTYSLPSSSSICSAVSVSVIAGRSRRLTAGCAATGPTSHQWLRLGVLAAAGGAPLETLLACPGANR